ncbi:hypothetical protein SBA4_990011 [Candidatus Sulfopaludibacter sp. SbA4]|nr:hypothetical protein SBA4_990011 [Candidatus Sulfopaludibacter sp. SbA4]
MVATMTSLIRIQTQLEWKCFRGNENWIAFNDALKLTVQAETWSELMESINETLDAVLEDLVHTNDLQKFLVDHGWQIASPLPVEMDNVRFDVPFSVVLQSGSHEHANQ